MIVSILRSWETNELLYAHLADIPCRFACVCSVDDQTYPQGQGKTKKEAKTNAAKIAFQIILGIDEEQDDYEGICVFFNTLTDPNSDLFHFLFTYIVASCRKSQVGLRFNGTEDYSGE